MIKRFKRLNNTGDTIVEVMIVLAVLGLALSISYATANRGLQQSRNAQEHSQALGIINSQVELLRSAFAKGAGAAIETQAGPTGGPFCLVPSGGGVAIRPLTNSGFNGFNENIANDHLGTTPPYPPDCIQNTFFNVSIEGRGNGVYDFRVRWNGIGQLGRQQEELTYKIGDLLVGAGGGYSDPEIPFIPPPNQPFSLGFSADSSTVLRGDNITLNWATNPTGPSCLASGAWAGGQPDHGSTTVPADPGGTSSSVSFTLTCTSTSETHSSTVTVNINEKQKLMPFNRYWGLVNGHFYSSDPNPPPGGILGYTSEGTAGKIDTIQAPGEIPLYYAYNTGLSDHLYTISASEQAGVAGSGYTQQGISGYILPYSGSCPSNAQPLYRMYSSSLVDHFYTTDFNEYSQGKDLSGKFGLQSIAWYDYPEGIIGCTYK